MYMYTVVVHIFTCVL